MRNANPRSVYENQEMVAHKQFSFGGGVISDIPITALPEDAIADSENWVPYAGARAEGRTGSQILHASSVGLPQLNTLPIVATKSGTTITVISGYSPSSADVGRYFVWDDAGTENEYITAKPAANQFTVTSSTAHAQSTAAGIRAEINAALWHSKQQKWIIMIGTEMYYASWNITAWTKIYNVSTNFALTNAKSKIIERGGDAYLFNANGIYRVEISQTIPTLQKINQTMQERSEYDIFETEDNKYCRKYITTLSEMSGNTLLNRMNGNTVVQESAPNIVGSDGQDWTEVWTEKPIGPADTTYGVLTGGTLAAGVNTAAEWEVITDGTVSFSANGETYPIQVDFSGCLTFSDVAFRIQAALRDKWPSCKFEFDTNRFVFTMPNGGDSVDYCTVATGGTGISGASYLNMTSAASGGTITSPTVTQNIVGILGGTEQLIATAAFSARYGHQVVQAGNGGNVFLIGGYDPNGPTYYNDIWKTSDGITWTQVTVTGSQFTARHGHTVLWYDSKLWVIGGIDISSTLNDVWYSADSGVTWTQCAAPTPPAITFTARHHHASVVYTTLGLSRMWIIGGTTSTGTYYNDAWSSIDGISWVQETASATFSARGNHKVVVHNSYMYLIGGAGLSGLKNDVYISNNGSSWTSLTTSAQFFNRSDHAAISFDSKLWVMGGYYPGVTFDDLWWSDTGVTWYRLTDGVVPFSRSAFGLVAYDTVYEHGEQMWVIGGRTSALNVFNDVWKIKRSYLLLPQWRSTYYEESFTEYTHWTKWATMDVGVNGINPQSGKGNNPELFIWCADIPLIKAFIITSAATGVVTAAKGTFGPEDVGSILVTRSVADVEVTAVITEYRSPTTVVWSIATVVTAQPANIGSARVFKCTQSAYTVTAAYGSGFADTDVGARIFWDDGTTSIITVYTSATVVTVADSTTRTDMCAGMLGHRRYGPDTSNMNIRRFNDTITDDILYGRIGYYYLLNRFWEAMPDCNTGTILLDWMAGALRGGDRIYYSDLSLTNDDRLSGYYHPGYQSSMTSARITELRSYKNYLAAFCVGQTASWDATSVLLKKVAELGESIRILAHMEIVSKTIGVSDWGSIAEVTEGLDIVKTSDNEIRTFNGVSYGENVAGNKIMREMRQLQPLSAASYDPIEGYRLYGTKSALTNSRVPFADTCWRFALTDEQGIGAIKMTGTGLVRPPDSISPETIVDANGNRRHVTLDNKTGKPYWISTYDGPSGSGLTRYFVDKADSNGANGTEIVPTLWLRGHTGTLEHYFMKFLEGHLYFKPMSESNRSTTGHDANGYRTGIEIDLYMYADRNPTTEKYKTLNIPKDGDISLQWDDNPQVNVSQIKITANRSEMMLTGAIFYYWMMNRADAPTQRTMQESTSQETMASPVLYVNKIYGDLKNMLTGTTVTPGTYSWAADPKGDSAAIAFSTALTFDAVDLTNGSVVFWTKTGTVALTIGGTAVALTTYGDAVSGWSLCYATGITLSGAVVLTPTGTPNVSLFRLFNAEITTAMLAYLYNDVYMAKYQTFPVLRA